MMITSTLIINYVVALAALLQCPRTQDLFPSLHLFTNNVTSKLWIIKGARKSAKGRVLSHLQCCLMINNPIGINISQVSMFKNVNADCISQFPNNAHPLTPFLSLTQEFLWLQHYKYFFSSAELVLCILDAPL